MEEVRILKEEIASQKKSSVEKDQQIMKLRSFLEGKYFSGSFNAWIRIYTLALLYTLLMWYVYRFMFPIASKEEIRLLQEELQEREDIITQPQEIMEGSIEYSIINFHLKAWIVDKTFNLFNLLVYN